VEVVAIVAAIYVGEIRAASRRRLRTLGEWGGHRAASTAATKGCEVMHLRAPCR